MLVTDKPSVVSPVLTVNVSVVVGTRTTRTHVHRGGHVHFSGTVQPGVANIPMAIQKLDATDHWVTSRATVTRTGGTYGKTVRIRRGGSYRVYAAPAAARSLPASGARSASTRAARRRAAPQPWHSCEQSANESCPPRRCPTVRASCWHSPPKSANHEDRTQPLSYGGQ